VRTTAAPSSSSSPRIASTLSCLDAFHYLEAALGFGDVPVLGVPVEAILAAGTILLIGGLNWFGPTKTGTIAMVIALAMVALTLVIGVRAVLHVTGALPLAGLGAVRLGAPLARGLWPSWVGFTEIVLALSGVEAIANMTGIMVPPVERTARRSILPVLVEIVVLNLILAAAMNTLPDSVLQERTPSGELAHTGDMLKVIAAHYVGPTFATISSIVFALLLLSATNTAVGALVSVQFMLSRDRELPHAFGGLNRYGMPLIPLYVAAIIPAIVLLLFPEVEALADLYAIGVVGAIAINLGSISTSRAPIATKDTPHSDGELPGDDVPSPRRELTLRGWERALMLTLTLILTAIEVTICVVKPHARGFALIVLVIGLAGRLATIVTNRAVPIAAGTRTAYLAFAAASVALVLALAVLLGDTLLGSGLAAMIALGVGYASFQTQSYRAVLIAAEAAPAPALARPRMLQEGAYKARERVMVATQGNPRLIAFALKECKSRQAELQLLFIRHLAVTPMGTAPIPTLAEDTLAQELFDRVRAQAKEAGVPLRLLYGVARDIPDAILDMAVTHGADLLLLGTTRRGTLWKAMKGDVIQAVAEQLPETVGLLIHA
jgi:amino acid transporter/nucleotide-binding universal stress UspA family protein